MCCQHISMQKSLIPKDRYSSRSFMYLQEKYNAVFVKIFSNARMNKSMIYDKDGILYFVIKSSISSLWLIGTSRSMQFFHENKNYEIIYTVQFCSNIWSKIRLFHLSIVRGVTLKLWRVKSIWPCGFCTNFLYFIRSYLHKE